LCPEESIVIDVDSAADCKASIVIFSSLDSTLAVRVTVLLDGWLFGSDASKHLNACLFAFHLAVRSIRVRRCFRFYSTISDSHAHVTDEPED